MKAPVVLAQHERLAPGHRHETFFERRTGNLESGSAIGIQVGVDPGVDDVLEQPEAYDVVSPEREVKRAGAVCHGAREIEVLTSCREEDAVIANHLHQPHRDQDRSVPALPFDELRGDVRGPAGAPQCDASGVEAVILGGRR